MEAQMDIGEIIYTDEGSLATRDHLQRTTPRTAPCFAPIRKPHQLEPR